MSDINTNISVNIDTSNALGQLKNLQRQISTFHQSVAKSSQTASIAQADLQRNFINSINSIGAFSAELRTVKTTAENFTSSLEKNKFSMRQYFSYAGGATKTFGKLFKAEYDTIGKVAEESVKNLQTQYIKMGRDANGAMKAIAVRPLSLDMNSLSTQTQIAAQKQAIFNQLVKQGSTNLLNFGKNTQWAGRQLMVGFTLPLMTLGTTAAKTFMDMEAQVLKFKKVYGDLFTAPEETQAALDGITELGQGFTKYGIAVSKTVGLAAEAAAAGFAGVDLQRQTTAATRLSVLGQIEQQQALETTISLQNALGISSADLGASIDFLNAVENQTVTSLDDITIAIPKVAPVIKSLGGDVKDLAFFLTAMKEGGINASEGANALKSGLASMINPSKKSAAMLADMGININAIVEGNAGNLRATVIEFAQALDTLAPLQRARAIEQMFGKFQFARLSTLFQNVTKDGTQAARVLDLAGSSVSDLAALSEKELGMTADSAMNKFRKSVEDLKFALVPVGQVFLEVVTPFIEKISGIIQKFNGLSASTKKIITLITIAFGAIAPIVLMTVGLFANFIANGIKGLMILRTGYLKLTGQSQVLSEQTNYLTVEQQNALAAAHSLEQSHAKLIQIFSVETGELVQLKNAYQAANLAASNFALRNPAMMVPPAIMPKKFADGKPSIVGGTGNKDSELSLLQPGETVIPTKMSKKYGGLINGMIADNIPGYYDGRNAIRFGEQEFNIPISPQTKPEALNVVFSKFSNDIEGITRVLQGLETQAAESGSTLKVTAQSLKKALTEANVVRNRPQGKSATEYKGQMYVAAHSMPPLEDITDPAIIQELADATSSESMARKLNSAIANNEAVKQFSNFVTILPQEANKKAKGGNFLMGRDEMAGLFQGNQADRSMAMVYKRYMDRLGVTFDQIVQDPALFNRMTQSVTGLATFISEEISLLPESFGEQDYYDAVAKAIARLDAGDTALVETIRDLQAPGMLAATGARDPLTGKGKAQERSGVGKTDTRLQVELGTPEGMEGYKSEGNAPLLTLADKIGREKAHAEALAYNEELKKTTQDIYPASRKRNSPHDLVPKDARDDANAYEDAAQQVFKKRRAATLAQGAPVPLPPPGATMLPIVSAPLAAASQEKIASSVLPPAGATILPIVSAPLAAASEKIKETVGVTSSKLGSLNKSLNAVSLGLTSAAGAGTMFGGKIGEVSSQIFKYSGLMFGLMQITQLLTQVGFARLVAERAATTGILTKTATDAVGGATFARTAGLFAGGTKQLIPNLWKLGQKIIGMLGPWGKLATIAIAVGGGLFKLKSMADAQKEKIDGLGNAAFIAGDRLKTLGDIFGIIPQQFLFENLPKGTGGAVAMTGEQSTLTEKVRQEPDFIKNYGKDIAALKGATTKQAELIFKGLVVQLQGRGLIEEQVQAVINAIKLESGKTDIELDFKNISILTPESRAKVQKDVISLIKLSKTVKDFKAVGGSLAGLIGAIGLAFSNGAISAEDYASQMTFINMQVAAMSYPDALTATDAMFKAINEKLPDTVKGISSVTDRLMLLNALALKGIGLDSPLFKQLQSADPEVVAKAQAELNKLTKEGMSDYAANAAKVAAAKKAADAGAYNGGGTPDKVSALAKKVIAGLQKEVGLLEKKKKALEGVNKELDRQQEFQMKQQQLDADMVQAKISGNYIQAALLGQQKLYNKSQFDRETAEIKLDEQIQKLQDRIDALEKGGKVTDLDKKLAKIESNAKGGGGSGGGTKSPIKAPTADSAKTSAEGKATIGYGKEAEKQQLKFLDIIKLGQANNKNIVYDNGTPYHHVQIGTQSYFVTSLPIKKYYAGKFKPEGGFTRVGQAVGFASGGLIKGPGTGTSDSITAKLGYAGGGSIRVSNGEFVMKAKAVKDYGISTMNAMNNSQMPVANNGSTVYNEYHMNITGSNADDIANKVIRQLKVINDKNNKSNMVAT